LSALSRRHSQRRIPRTACRDITWWSTFASAWNGIYFISPHRTNINLYTDASGSKGIGGVLNSNWFSARLPKRYMKRDIQFKELFAVIHAILCWGKDFRGKHVSFHIDNHDIVTALTSLTFRSAPTMELVRHFLALACRLDFTFPAIWISSEDNALADAASRFQFTRLFELAPHLSPKSSPKTLHLLPIIPPPIHFRSYRLTFSQQNNIQPSSWVHSTSASP
jgi:hypothetical protein